MNKIARAPALIDQSARYQVPGFFVPRAVLVGVVESVQPGVGPGGSGMPDMSGPVAAGLRQRVWGDYFYDNVFMTPSAIDAGLITGGASYAFSFWSSYTNALTLKEVDQEGDADTALTGLSQGLVRSFVSQIYTLGIDENGDDLDYRATFSFTGAAPVIFTLTGTRAAVIPWAIDWSATPELNLQYLTEVHESFDGNEQRVSLRRAPRVSVNYQYTFADRDAYRFDNLVHNVAGPFLLPLWMFGSELSESAQTGDTSLSVSMPNQYLLQADRVILTNGTDHEVFEVASTAGQVIELKSLVKKNYGLNSKLLPLMTSRVANETSSMNYTRQVGTYTMTFEGVEGKFETPAITSSFTEYNGKKVLDVKPDWGQSPTTSFNRLRETFDSDTGLQYVYDKQPGAVRTYSYQYLHFSHADRQKLEDFAASCRGAQGEFYVQAPNVAMELVEDVRSASKQIVVSDAYYSSFKKSLSFAPGIMIVLYNGTTLCRTVLSVERTLNDKELITLDEELANISVEDVDYISPLYLARFDSDGFRFLFSNETTSSITKTIKTLLHADTGTD
ncbi:hypothetical protein [Pseudomonas asplenii]|uniref:hypothetical protein n=1 Tax=Pseudomonas asplenii TaxID=53407 RepID=UPI00035FA461|nr:hypothetical protein [Pseudomonas fuscovaginae]